MSTPSSSEAVRSQAFWMFLAAAIFGYIGFRSSWQHRFTVDSPPQLLIMVVVLMWSLRGGCIAFAIAAVLALSGASIALLLYAFAGIVTAIAFAAVAYWDFTSQQYYSGVDPVLLLIFAAWNGFSSVLGLREWLAMQRGRPPASAL